MIRERVSGAVAVLLLTLPMTACGQAAESPAQQPASSAAAAKKEGDAVSLKIKTELEKKYAEMHLKVQDVRPTPVAGLYEVLVGGNRIVYVDKTARYMFVGDLLDMNTKQNLTQVRVDAEGKIDFSTLPLQHAVKEVRGNGKRQLAVFSDPDCPYCKRLETELGKMTDITIYTFLMPIPSLHPGAVEKSVQIWCQKDKAKAWTDWMRHGIMPPAVAECPNPVGETLALGAQMDFNGTPTMVFPNGKSTAGYMERAQLEELIDANQK